MDLNSKEGAFYPKTRDEWREWLIKNHTKEKNVWLILYNKNSKNPSITYDDAVEEALCFGWIDSKPNNVIMKAIFFCLLRENQKATGATQIVCVLKE